MINFKVLVLIFGLIPFVNLGKEGPNAPKDKGENVSAPKKGQEADQDKSIKASTGNVDTKVNMDTVKKAEKIETMNTIEAVGAKKESVLKYYSAVTVQCEKHPNSYSTILCRSCNEVPNPSSGKSSSKTSGSFGWGKNIVMLPVTIVASCGSFVKKIVSKFGFSILNIIDEIAKREKPFYAFVDGKIHKHQQNILRAVVVAQIAALVYAVQKMYANYNDNNVDDVEQINEELEDDLNNNF